LVITHGAQRNSSARLQVLRRPYREDLATAGAAEEQGRANAVINPHFAHVSISAEGI
jgi:hypothetical protein